MPSQLSPPKKGQGTESQSPKQRRTVLLQAPHGKRPHERSVSPTPLCYLQLWEAACTQCDRSLGSPRAPIWTSGRRRAGLREASHMSFLLNQKYTPGQTSTEKPELTYILLGEGSAGTRRLRAHSGLGKGTGKETYGI